MKRAAGMMILALAALVATRAAGAQELDWYAGLGVASELDGRGPFDFGGGAEAEHAGTLFAGARFAHGFGVEAAYVDLGRLRHSAVADAGYDVDGELWSVGAIYALSLEALEPYVKLGWFSREEDGVAISIAGPAPLRLDDDGVMAEVGLRWRASEAFALRLGYAWYDFEPESDGSAQAGLEWHF